MTATSSPTAGGPGASPPRRGWVGLAIGPIFFALAAWFIVGPDALDLPGQVPATVDLDRLTTAPRRTILQDPPIVRIDGFGRSCMDCHQLFPPRDDPPVALAQHQHIVLNHGINKQCRNCHDTKDRNLLVLRGGETITYGEVEVLCAKCHGPVYRDWQNGAHGRTNGYWDTARGPQRRLRCTECHDPHNPRVPAMDPLVPLPGPATLRMHRARHDEPATDPGGSAAGDPLRQAIRRSIARERAQSAAEPPPAQTIEYLDPSAEDDE